MKPITLLPIIDKKEFMKALDKLNIEYNDENINSLYIQSGGIISTIFNKNYRKYDST
jgi:hypothetical protein